jgi:hypothetical protein
MSSLLQNKLLQYEFQPPEGVWDKIAASLDQNISPAVSEKLYQFEESPSPAVWQKIISTLDTVTEKAKVVPFYTRYRRPLKYSGAVAIFIFLAVLTSLLISKKTESELPAEGLVINQQATKKDTVTILRDSKEANPVTPTIEKNHSEPSIAKAKVSKTRKSSTANSIALAEDLLPKQAQRTSMIGSSFNADNYMIYSDGDGNAVRLPKKLFSAFACPTDNIDCKQRLQRLREKFAESAMTADFTGLLQILKSLQENQ